MKPKLALVYSADDQGSGAMEIWRIAGNRLIDPQRPSPEGLAELALHLKDVDTKDDLSGMIGPRVLYLNKKRIAFFEPCGVHTTYYATKDGPAKEVRIWTPNTVFTYDASRKEVHVYWSCENIDGVREGSSCLMAAAMPNVSSLDGHMCMGTAFDHVKMDNDIPNVCRNVSRAFYGSAFTEWRTEDIGPIMAWCEKAVTRKKEAMTNWTEKIQNIRAKLGISTQWKRLSSCIGL